MKSFESRVAIITGAASGIGLGTAKALARRGARLVLADLDRERLSEAAEALGAPVLAHPCDVGEDGAFPALREAALARFGRVDIVMNNAGVIAMGRPEDIPLAEWQRVVNINFMALVRSNHAFLPGLIAQGEGHIVNTASFAALFPYAYDRLPYMTSKAAVIALSEGLALYLRPKGIGVTCLCPGPVKTNIGATIRRFTDGLALRGPGVEFAALEPEAVGEMVADAILANRFFLPTDDLVMAKMRERAADPSAFIERQLALFD